MIQLEYWKRKTIYPLVLIPSQQTKGPTKQKHLGITATHSTLACGPGWSGVSADWCCGSLAASWRAAGSFEETHVENPWVSSSGILQGNRLWTLIWAEWEGACSSFVPVASPRLQPAHPLSSPSWDRSWWWPKDSQELGLHFAMLAPGAFLMCFALFLQINSDCFEMFLTGYTAMVG